MRNFTVCLIASLFLSSNQSLASTPNQSLSAVAETVLPQSRIPREDFGMCRSEIHNPTVIFKNTGSMCADGLFSLMQGRGCEIIVGANHPSGQWTYHKCETQPTCDRLHNNVFAVVPVGVSLSENFKPGYEMWCADNNYFVIKISKDSDI